MSRRKLIILIASVCVIALTAWGVLMYHIFQRDDRRTGGTTEKKPTVIPEVPEGCVLVWGVAEQYWIDENGRQQLVARWKQGKNGRCISMEDCTEPDSPLKRYTYDADTGETIESVKYNNGRSVLENAYNSRGVMVRETEYWENDVTGKLEISEEVLYNRDGNYLSRMLYSDGVMYCGYKYEYDIYGHMIECLEYDQEHLKWNLVRYAEVDDQYRLVKQYESPDGTGDSGSAILLLTVEYSDDGSRKEYSKQYEGDLTQMREYDANGNVIREAYQGSESDGVYIIELAEYAYDEKNRMVSREVQSTAGRSFRQYYDYTRSGQKCTETRVTEYFNESEGRFEGSAEARMIAERVLHGDSDEDDRRYDSEIITDAEYDKYGNVIWEYKYSTYYTYDEYDNLIRCEMYSEKDGKRSLDGGYVITYTPIVITEEQAAENANFYDPSSATIGWGYLK